ncbi:hypothetical protein C5167_042615 [Papaver somniferum]|uniref:Uncharacterized protein n=1 Tax=Papaver somniferum TaxID=3469 RepID=A0A4Y7L3B9_PAPSO|nr:hypothetical protein C5167_042615 [Papaver somniferum]
MCIFVIKPLAFQENCVGGILYAIESNSYGLRGLTLVKRLGSLSKPDDDEYLVAVVAFCVKPSFKILHGNVKNINYDDKVFKIGSDYLDRSPPGQGVMEAAKEFFKYGFSFWGNSDHCSGCLFEASFVGLKSLQ